MTEVKDLWVISKVSPSGQILYWIASIQDWGSLENAEIFDESALTELQLGTNEAWMRLVDAAMI